MIIELKGIATNNKGAHLMLLSILEEFKKREKHEIFCTEPRPGMDYKSAGLHGIYLKENLKGRKIPWSTLFNLLPQKTRRSYGLVMDQEIDLILDGSGFAYGDFWGAKKIESRLGNFINAKTKSNSKLILLPQALGPFKNQSVKKSFQKVVDKADLIFARDTVSYNNLIESYGDKETFKLAPDFTNLLYSGEIKEYEDGEICIIPNYKMIPDSTSKEKYYRFLIDSINYLNKSGNRLYFLIHEGKKDRKIAENINLKLDTKLKIVEPYDALEIKNRIKSSKLIIVSRFHGLVSALSQGVPAISTSWSHKYLELLKDYDLENHLIDIHNYDRAKLFGLIDASLSKNENLVKDNQLIKINEQKSRSNNTWDTIFKVIYGEVQSFRDNSSL